MKLLLEESTKNGQTFQSSSKTLSTEMKSHTPCHKDNKRNGIHVTNNLNLQKETCPKDGVCEKNLHETAM